MQTSPHRVSVPSWQPVRGIEDLEFLVKESEVLTGRSGRRFVVASADRLHYLVHWRSPALVIERIDGHGIVRNRQLLLPWEFEEHPVAQAIASRQLFAASVLTEA